MWLTPIVSEEKYNSVCGRENERTRESEWERKEEADGALTTNQMNTTQIQNIVKHQKKFRREGPSSLVIPPSNQPTNQPTNGSTDQYHEPINQSINTKIIIIIITIIMYLTVHNFESESLTTTTFNSHQSTNHSKNNNNNNKQI